MNGTMSELPKKHQKIQRLVIVDDEETEQMLNRFIVERSGLVGELTSFLSASEALSYLKHNHKEVDAVLLDLNMPVMDGFDFLDAIQKELGELVSGIPFSILTSSIDGRDIERAKSYEMVTGYFSKPLTSDHLNEISCHLKQK